MMYQRARSPDADFHDVGRQMAQCAQHAFDGANAHRPVFLNYRITDDPALASVNDTRLGALAAFDFTGDETHAASPAVSGAAIKGQVDSVVQRSIEQQFAASRQKALFIYRNSVAFCHCEIPEGSKFDTLRSARSR
jgi:hypothetical protein